MHLMNDTLFFAPIGQGDDDFGALLDVGNVVEAPV